MHDDLETASGLNGVKIHHSIKEIEPCQDLLFYNCLLIA